MPKPPNLTDVQKARLAILEPALRKAVHEADFESAKIHASDIQALLRPTGHETRLMQSKTWLFEAAMQAGHLDLAESGFQGIRKKTAPGTRVHLEATALLTICFLRQKRLEEAEPLMRLVVRSENIRGEERRKKFLRMIVRRFEEEGLFAALRDVGYESLDPDDIDSAAIVQVQTITEDEMFAIIGASLPRDAVDFLLKIDLAAKRQLEQKETLYLPTRGEIEKPTQLGRSVFGSLKATLWRSLCDPESEIYKVWYGQGFAVVLNRKYFATAVAAICIGLGLGVRAIAISVTALLIKFGLEVYCDRFKPECIMDDRLS